MARSSTKGLGNCAARTSAVTLLLSAALILPSACLAQQMLNSSAQQAPAPRDQQIPPPAQQTQPSAPPQQQATSPQPPLPPAIEEQFVQNPNAPCVQPPPPVTWRDYQGPFAKTVGLFAERLERKSVAPSATSQRHYKAGTLLCTLEVRDKFWLFVRDSTDPVAFINAGYNAVTAQVQDSQPTFGRGFTGYLDRFGANMAGQSSAGFFKDFLYPTIFEEDPRYYRLGTGTTERRVFHALGHVVVAHNENGNRMFNFSEWLGDASVIVLSNTYLPDNRRGVMPVAESMASTMGNNMGWDLLREFWPEIAKKFHLPFREQNPPVVVPSS